MSVSMIFVASKNGSVMPTMADVDSMKEEFEEKLKYLLDEGGEKKWIGLII